MERRTVNLIVRRILGDDYFEWWKIEFDLYLYF
jgi:hypothetical protein